MAAGDEVWVAIATHAADGTFVADGPRDLLFAIIFDTAGAELWEPSSDWPSAPLEWFEVARLVFREPISPLDAAETLDVFDGRPDAHAIVAALPPSSAWRARSIRAAKSSR